MEELRAEDCGVPLVDPTLSTFWEIEQGECQISDEQGRLRSSLDFWIKDLDPAPWIINCIWEGYKLPLRTVPDRYYRPNQASALEHKDFVSQTLRELEQNRCLIKVPE